MSNNKEITNKWSQKWLESVVRARIKKYCRIWGVPKRHSIRRFHNKKTGWKPRATIRTEEQQKKSIFYRDFEKIPRILPQKMNWHKKLIVIIFIDLL